MSRHANTKDVSEMIKTAFKVPKALENRKMRLFYKPKAENQKPQPWEISETITLNSSDYSSQDVKIFCIKIRVLNKLLSFFFYIH